MKNYIIALTIVAFSAMNVIAQVKPAAQSSNASMQKDTNSNPQLILTHQDSVRISKLTMQAKKDTEDIQDMNSLYYVLQGLHHLQGLNDVIDMQGTDAIK